MLGYSAKTVAGLRFFGAPDPRFTPDQQRDDQSMTAEELAADGRRVAERLISVEPPEVDVALVHDPVVAQQLADNVPLVLAGHVHKRKQIHRGQTLILVEGSTGGAGLRSLDHSSPTPLECSILYFDRKTKRLQAYDEVTVGGLGLASVQMKRHVVTPLPDAGASPTPSPSGSVEREPHAPADGVISGSGASAPGAVGAQWIHAPAARMGARRPRSDAHRRRRVQRAGRPPPGSQGPRPAGAHAGGSPHRADRG